MGRAVGAGEQREGQEGARPLSLGMSVSWEASSLLGAWCREAVLGSQNAGRAPTWCFPMFAGVETAKAEQQASLSLTFKIQSCPNVQSCLPTPFI